MAIELLQNEKPIGQFATITGAFNVGKYLKKVKGYDALKQFIKTGESDNAPDIQQDCKHLLDQCKEGEIKSTLTNMVSLLNGVSRGAIISMD